MARLRDLRYRSKYLLCVMVLKWRSDYIGWRCCLWCTLITFLACFSTSATAFLTSQVYFCNRRRRRAAPVSLRVLLFLITALFTSRFQQNIGNWNEIFIERAESITTLLKASWTYAVELYENERPPDTMIQLLRYNYYNLFWIFLADERRARQEFELVKFYPMMNFRVARRPHNARNDRKEIGVYYLYNYKCSSDDLNDRTII